MIEISAKLLRGHVFLTGEIAECSISFRHVASHRGDGREEAIAWASAQICCQCSSTDARGNRSAAARNRDAGAATAGGDTALGGLHQDGGTATRPKILFCDIRLLPGETKTYIYREKIGSDAPPSYRGQLIKYSYKIVVGMQRVNSAVRLLRIPIRVLPLCETILNEASAFCNDTSEELSRANPFLEVRRKETHLDIALQNLQNITARRNPFFYMISNSRGKVARFCLFKSSYKLGEDIIGTFDFGVGTVRCVQVSASLQCEEIVAVQQRPGRTSDANANDGHPAAGQAARASLLTYSRQHEVCAGYSHTQLVLPIPLHVTPAFATSLVKLQWRVHFEFVTCAGAELEAAPEGAEHWTAPGEVPIETMVWSLPVKVYATVPKQVAQGMQTNAVHSMICV